jgi:dipeptidyl aminopeptidase/acylaminoacyl peptidase
MAITPVSKDRIQTSQEERDEGPGGDPGWGIRLTERARLIPREVIFGNPVKTGATISPDGHRLAYLAPLKGVLNVFVGDSAGGGARPATHSTSAPVTAYFWAYDNRHLLVLRDRDGDENHHVHAVDLETGATRDLTPFDGCQAEGIFLSPEVPGEMLVGINATNPEWHDLYRVTLSTGKIHLERANPGFGAWLVDRTLTLRGGTRPLDDSGWELVVIDGDGWRSLLTVAGDDALNSGVVGVGPGDSLFILTSEGSDTNRLIRLDAVSGATEQIAHDPEYDLSGIQQHPATGELTAVSVSRQRQDFVYLSPVIAPDIERLKAAGLGEPGITSTDLGYQRWVVAFRSDVASTSYQLFDRASGTLTHLFDEQPALGDYQLAPMEPFAYRARDGLGIEGYLSFPPDLPRESLPTILLVHGGPWGRTEWGLNGHAQQLTNRGYLVAQVNFRGSTGYGKAFVNAGDKEWGAKMNDDLVDAVRHLVDAGYADPAKVGICGGSYGGYASLAAVAFSPDVFACAVAERGPVNLVSLIERVPPYWKPLISLFHRRVGNPETEREFLRERSPLTHVDKIRAPLLLSYGAQDPRVTRAEAEQIAAALDAHGADYELIMFENEGHGLSRPENRMRMFTASEEFFARHLGGRCEAPAAAEAMIA